MAEVSDATEGPGSALKAAREALGVSVREVAAALNLPVHIIEGMEADDYDHLPQPVFTRGYLRSYARLLELDADAMVARMPRQQEVEPDLTAEMEAIAPRRISLLGVPVWTLVAASVVLLVLLWLLISWLGSDNDEAADTAPQSSSATVTGSPSAARPDPVSTAPAAGVVETGNSPGQAAQVADAAQTEPAPIAETDPVPEPPAESAPEAAAPVLDSEPRLPETGARSADADSGLENPPPAAVTPDVDAPVAAPTPPGMRRITPFGDDLLELEFAEDCWVEVKDRDGALLYGDLNRAGGSLKLIGRAPYRVLLGYAPGVVMTFNEETVDLAPSIRNNVANVVVGR